MTTIGSLQEVANYNLSDCTTGLTTGDHTSVKKILKDLQKDCIDTIAQQTFTLYGQMHTLLTYAAKRGYTEIGELLLDANADIDATVTHGGGAFASWNNEHNETALHLAILNDHTGFATMLVTRGADVNKATCEGKISTSAKITKVAKDANDGRTPLIMACQHGHDALARLLVDQGALNCSYRGESVIEIAETSCPSVVEFLKDRYTPDHWSLEYGAPAP